MQKAPHSVWLTTCLLTALALGGCSAAPAQNGSVQAADAAAAASGPSESALDTIPPEAETELTVGEARALLAEGIDTENYIILEADSNLEIDGESYFVFIVAEKETNKAVGQLAVHKLSGARYHYEGEGVLGAYSDFSLPDETSKAASFAWNGEFTDGERTLLLAQSGEASFAYTLGRSAGIASISGLTAADGALLFTAGEDGSITLSGSDTGVFTLQ